MTTDAQQALAQVREALAAGPTPGPWVTMPANAGVHCVARINAWEAVPPSDCELSHDSIDASFIAACSPANMSAILTHVEAQAAEIERLTAERDELRDVLLRNGFVPCDIPACNCGSWHHRYGLPERMQEIKDALAEAGQELSNANGNLPINALKALVAERDELRRQLDPMGEYTSADELIAVLRAEKAEDEAMKLDARRYRWLRGEHKRVDPICAVIWKRNGDRNGSEWVNTANIDAEIDAAMGASNE